MTVVQAIAIKEHYEDQYGELGASRRPVVPLSDRTNPSHEVGKVTGNQPNLARLSIRRFISNNVMYLM